MEDKHQFMATNASRFVGAFSEHFLVAVTALSESCNCSFVTTLLFQSAEANAFMKRLHASALPSPLPLARFRWAPFKRNSSPLVFREAQIAAQ